MQPPRAPHPDPQRRNAYPVPGRSRRSTQLSAGPVHRVSPRPRGPCAPSLPLVNHPAGGRFRWQLQRAPERASRRRYAVRRSDPSPVRVRRTVSHRHPHRWARWPTRTRSHGRCRSRPTPDGRRRRTRGSTASRRGAPGPDGEHGQALRPPGRPRWPPGPRRGGPRSPAEMRGCPPRSTRSR